MGRVGGRSGQVVHCGGWGGGVDRWFIAEGRGEEWTGGSLRRVGGEEWTGGSLRRVGGEEWTGGSLRRVGGGGVDRWFIANAMAI